MSDRSGDNYAHSVEARIAVLEDVVRRLDSRLEQVSTRTHTLTSAVQEVSLLSEEAREQRAEIINKVNSTNNSVSDLTRAMLTVTMDVGYHVKQCDKRGGRLEKIGLSVLAAVLALGGGLALWYVTRRAG